MPGLFDNETFRLTVSPGAAVADETVIVGVPVANTSGSAESVNKSTRMIVVSFLVIMILL